MTNLKVMQKRRRRRVPRQKARDDGNEKEEFVVEIKVGLLTPLRRGIKGNHKTVTWGNGDDEMNEAD